MEHIVLTRQACNREDYQNSYLKSPWKMLYQIALDSVKSFFPYKYPVCFRQSNINPWYEHWWIDRNTFFGQISQLKSHTSTSTVEYDFIKWTSSTCFGNPMQQQTMAPYTVCMRLLQRGLEVEPFKSVNTLHGRTMSYIASIMIMTKSLISKTVTWAIS